MYAHYLKKLRDTILFFAKWGRLILTPQARTNKHIRRDANRVLLLVSDFPPAISGGVFRPLSLAKYGVEMGYEYTVVCGPAPRMPTLAGLQLLQQLPEQVKVCRVEKQLDPVDKLLPHVDGGFLNIISVVEKTIEVMGGQPPGAIIASGPTFHNFIAAYYLANYYHATLALDYRDEWSECPFDFVSSGRTDRKWEAKCLRRADRVIFTTESQMRHNAAVFRNYNHAKSRVIPNGWEPEDFDHVPSEKQTGSNGKVTISFVGTVGTYNLPEPFLRPLSAILARRPDLRGRVVVNFVGRKVAEGKRQIARHQTGLTIHDIDVVPKKEVSRVMQESDALLLINDPQLDRYIPGKLYDYLASKKPIVCVGTTGETARIIGELSAGFLIPLGDEGALESALNLLSEGKCGNILNHEVVEWLDKHTRRLMTHDMMRFVSNPLSL